MTQHTALPWKYRCFSYYADGRRRFHDIVTEDGGQIARLSKADERVMSNAEFIVRAVNNFYPLLEALERLDAFIPDREGLQPVDAEVRAFMEHEGIWRAKELARDAIERAKERK